MFTFLCMRKALWLTATLLFLGGGTSSSGFAATEHYMDIDGTLLHDSGLNSKGKLPAFWTPWRMVRVQNVGGGWALDTYERLKSENKLPREILITRYEYDLYRDRFAHAQEINGRLEPVPLLPDPLAALGQSTMMGVRPEQIYPGFYMVVPELTFEFHKEGVNGEPHMYQAFVEAMARYEARPDKYEFRGEAFPFLRRILAKQSLTERLYLLTDREPGSREWPAIWDAAYAHGYLPNPTFEVDGQTRYPNILSMTAASARVYGSMSEFSKRKARLLVERVARLSRSTLPKHEVLVPDMNGALTGRKEWMHELRVYENDPDYIREAIPLLRQAAANYPNVKITLFHAAADVTKLRAADFNRGRLIPSRWVIFTPGGKGWRQPFRNELRQLSATAIPSICETALSGGEVVK